MIPIDRGGGSAAERALDTAARVLERGELFGIYPEGTRARDGRLHRGHTGPARLALRTQARSEEHTSELQSLMRISYAVFCLKKKKTRHKTMPASKQIPH